MQLNENTAWMKQVNMYNVYTSHYNLVIYII